MSRKYFIAGNWKMNKTAAEAAALIGAIREKIGSQTKVDVAVCLHRHRRGVKSARGFRDKARRAEHAL